ncbi:MAG: hypothetical protein B0W54_16020 [Cellvibrio sp. 79]|nr:MAG: hypothetical protein B0W54_16020 [Cellvibrio sp. 79]
MNTPKSITKKSNSNLKNSILFSLLASTISSANISVAATPITKFELETGAEYDSNLSVIELDKSSSEGDWSALANARLNSQWQATDKAKVKGGLSYSSKTYRDFSEFDLVIKQAFIDTSYDFQPLTLGASIHYADAELDGSDFLALQQRSIYISRLINQKIFLRAAINDQDKDFPGSSARNADNHSVAGDAFFFFNQGKTFLTVGLSSETENAAANEFDYDGTNIRTSLSHQFSLWNKKNRLQASWRYDQRDYSAVTPALEAKRNDERRIATLEWQIETNNWLSVVGKVERGNYDSNLASANYAETVSSLMLKASF